MKMKISLEKMTAIKWNDSEGIVVKEGWIDEASNQVKVHHYNAHRGSTSESMWDCMDHNTISCWFPTSSGSYIMASVNQI